MKAKKAIKRLDKVEAILSDVIGQYASDEKETLEFLDTARSSVAHAKAGVSKGLKPAHRKASSKKNSSPAASSTKRKSVSAETRKAPASTKTASAM